MLETKMEQREVTVGTAIVCDRCKRRVELGDGDSADVFEGQEFVHLGGTGGYGSVIGDMVEWRLDLCQHCLVELCGPYLQYPGDEEAGENGAASA